jgi:hypothetical protein
MPGKLYANNFRLDVAYGEGLAGYAVQPPAGTPEAEAYAAGAADALVAPVVIDNPAMPDSTWLKADIIAWIVSHPNYVPSPPVSLTEAELQQFTKAQLLDMVDVP